MVWLSNLLFNAELMQRIARLLEAAPTVRCVAALRAIAGMNKTDVAKKVGTLLGERATKAGVSKVSFDRGTYKYHGRVKALADGAREAGLEF